MGKKTRTTPQGDRARARLLDAVRTLSAQTGRAPTYRELTDATGLSSGAIAHHLRVLEEQSLLAISAGARGIRLCEQTA